MIRYNSGGAKKIYISGNKARSDPLKGHLAQKVRIWSPSPSYSSENLSECFWSFATTEKITQKKKQIGKINMKLLNTFVATPGGLKRFVNLFITVA